MKNINKIAFTLVELIVVITILTILGTIAFTSLQGYSLSARNSKRISDIKNIDLSLELYRIKSSLYPHPENSVIITSSGTIFTNQGFIGNTLGHNLGIGGDFKDPQTNNFHYYTTTNDYKKYKLVYFLENEVAYNNSVSANNKNKTLKSLGDELFIVLDENRNMIQDIHPEGIIDLSDIGTNIYEIYLTDKINVSGNKDFLKNISYISCKDILDNNPSTFGNDGYYLISPDQISAFKVYCDMTTDGGGWTYWQGGKINSNTNNQEFTDYIEQKNNIPADFDNLYIVPDLLINKINFSESRTIMRGETGQYSNQIKYGKEISLLRDLKLESISYLDERDAMLSGLGTINTTFNFSTTYPGSEYNSNGDYTLNCNFIKGTTRLYCGEAIDSQNPFYQEYRIRYYPEGYLYAGNYQTLSGYGVHTCIRIIKDDNTQFSATCNEQYFSNGLFTNEEKLGSTDTCKSDILSWQNSITNPSCNYRDDPNRWYEWRDWLR